MSKTKNTKNGFKAITNKLGNTALVKKVPEEIAMKYKPKHKEQPEFILQKEVCQWLRKQYPKVMFMSDTIAAVKLTKPQAVRNKSIQKEGFKCPDLLIFEPRGIYHGLFIELKVETPFKKDGSIKASQDDHLLKQNKTLFNLYDIGYYACFAWTFEMSVDIITDYMNNNLNY